MTYPWVLGYDEQHQSLQVKNSLLSFAACEILWETGKSEYWVKEIEMGK